jgi:hypothetical protein
MGSLLLGSYFVGMVATNWFAAGHVSMQFLDWIQAGSWDGRWRTFGYLIYMMILWPIAVPLHLLRVRRDGGRWQDVMRRKMFQQARTRARDIGLEPAELDGLLKRIDEMLADQVQFFDRTVKR